MSTKQDQILTPSQAREELIKIEKLHKFIFSKAFTKPNLISKFPEYFDIWWPTVKDKIPHHNIIQVLILLFAHVPEKVNIWIQVN